MEIKQASAHQDFLDGFIAGKDIVITKKHYKDCISLYKNLDENLNQDTLMYKVYSYSKGNSNQIGNLNWGLTVMEPVLVNNECNITRGHFHEDLSCAEIYFCLHGEGLLLLMDENDNCFAEKMVQGSIHHIDGNLAHRLVNTGDEELQIGACWPTTAGHDYARIECNPFKVRIYKYNQEIKIEGEMI